MDVKDALKAGCLTEALSLAKQGVRKAPADPAQRSLLFQLYCIVGDWPAAATQLNLVGELDPTTSLFVGVAEKILDCEIERTRVFAGRQEPTLFGEPAPWIGGMVEAFRLSLQGKWEAAAASQAKALEAAPMTPARLGACQVDWLADADSRLGPLLEAFVDGRYYWVPFQRIRQLTLRPRTHLMDVIWAPVDFIWTNEGHSSGFIPVRYAGSEFSAEPLIQLGRKTEWAAHEGNIYQGIGHRIITTSEAELPLLEMDSVHFVTAEVAA